jgi:pimeloyl-ACP methyl ester carboxylesterase
LSLDRPGIGLSTVKPHRRIVDWPADVAGFADALEIGRLGVIGWSGGGPYVLACAARLATRLTGAALVAGVGPFDRTAALKGLSAMDRWSYRLARTTPAAARMALGAIYALSRRRPDQARQSFRSDRYQSKTAASSTHSAMEPSPWAGSSSRGVREPAAPSRSTAP